MKEFSWHSCSVEVWGNDQHLVGQGLSAAVNEELPKLMAGMEHSKSFHRPLSVTLLLRPLALQASESAVLVWFPFSLTACISHPLLLLRQRRMLILSPAQPEAAVPCSGSGLWYLQTFAQWRQQTLSSFTAAHFVLQWFTTESWKCITEILLNFSFLF